MGEHLIWLTDEELLLLDGKCKARNMLFGAAALKMTNGFVLEELKG